MKVRPDPAGPGQKSVWSFPRPAIAQPCIRQLSIVHRGTTVAATKSSVQTLETSHPPSYYFPPFDVNMTLRPNPRRSICDWKGQAVYLDAIVAGELVPMVAWSYANPTAEFEMLRGHIAFYVHSFDSCIVDGERAMPQPGGFYGGWITRDLAGPFKGGSGTQFW
ncbi:MAG: DUF427 domain-containing protein [Beijerinckiaceae bacterium]